MRSLIILALCVVLAACGGGQDTPPITKVFAVGGLLTYDPETGYGASPSAWDRDYVHDLGSALHATTQQSNILAADSIDRNTLVVIDEGYNLDSRQFEASLSTMLDQSAGSARIVCLSTWTPDPINVTLQRICAAHGAVWVDISDLWLKQLDGTGAPGDRTHAAIADAVLEALQ